MNAQIQRQQEITEALVRFRGIVLDDIPGHNDAIGIPVGRLVMRQHACE